MNELIKHQWLLILQKDTTDIMYLLMEEQNTLEAVLPKTKKFEMNIASRSTYQLTGSWWQRMLNYTMGEIRLKELCSFFYK